MNLWRQPIIKDRSGLPRKRGPSAPPAPWEPEHSGSLLLHYSALTAPRVVGGQTFLDERTGRTAALAAIDGVAGNQPSYSTLGDGMQAFMFPAAGAGTTRLQVDGLGLTVLEWSIFYVVRVTAVSASSQAAWALGSGSDQASLALDNTTNTAFQARLNAAGAYRNVTAVTPVDRLSQWITGRIDATAVGADHYVNGALYASNTWVSTIATPRTMGSVTIAANRPRTAGPAMEFAALLAFANPTAGLRTEAMDYLKRVWGARVTGW